MIHVEKVRKRFGSLEVLKGLSFRVTPGSWASLTGPSGSGKTTLLGILAGLESPDEGSVKINGVDLATLDEDARADFRARNMGFIFQSFRLIPHLTALENVEVPLEIIGEGERGAARALLEKVGLGDRLHHKPSELSGGEQQRVAIARAFVTRPRLLFADEPTGNLDSKNGAAVLALIHDLQSSAGSTVLVVTHDAEVAAQGSLALKLRDGELLA